MTRIVTSCNRSSLFNGSGHDKGGYMRTIKRLGQDSITGKIQSIIRRWHGQEVTIKAVAMTALCLLSTAGSYAQQTRSRAPNARYGFTLLVPVAGHVYGAAGTHFETDLSIINRRDVTQTVSVGFYGGDTFLYGDPAVETSVNIEAHSSQTFLNVTDSLLQSPGQLGAIIIRGTAGGLAAAYRTWTPQPGTGGTMSQSSAALDMDDFPPGDIGRVLIGVRHGAAFRTNVGMFCYVFHGCSFRVTGSSSTGSVTSVVDVAGYTLAQVPLPVANLGYMTVLVEPIDLSPDDRWAAYATTVDEVSGDSWLQNAVPR